MSFLDTIRSWFSKPAHEHDHPHEPAEPATMPEEPSTAAPPAPPAPPAAEGMEPTGEDEGEPPRSA
jgi:hypothetical protein